TPAPFFASGQEFTIVFSADAACAVQPNPFDSYPGEAYVLRTTAWQRLQDVDGRYDIPAQTLVQPPSGLGYLASFRGSHTVTPLVNAGTETGKVLIAGGNNVPRAEIFDPATGTVTSTGMMSVPRERHTATAL